VGGQLRLCPLDDDYYLAEVGAGESLVAHASFEPLAGTPDLAITDQAGKELSRAAGQGNERMTALLDPPAGSYLVRVTGTADAEAEYALSVRVVPPCPEGDDEDEPNDAAYEAAEIERDRPALLRACEDNEDWFKVKLAGKETAVATAVFDPSHGAVSLSRMSKDGSREEAKAQTRPETQGVSALPLEAGESDTEALIRVTADPGKSNFYVLAVKSPQGGKDTSPDKKKDQKQDRQKDKDKQDQKDQKQQQQQQPSTMEDQMKAMDHNERNIEAEKAMRAMPDQPRQPEKLW
jgi:hypothetical protein